MPTGSGPPDNTNIVSVEDVREVNVVPPQPDSRAMDELRETFAHQHKNKLRQIGWIGRLFGDRDEKLGNIAFITIIICFFMLGVIAYAPAKDGLSFKDAFGFLTNILTLTLGYLYGQRNGSK